METVISVKNEACSLAMSSKVVFVDECSRLNLTPVEEITPAALFDLFTADIIRNNIVFWR